MFVSRILGIFEGFGLVTLLRPGTGGCATLIAHLDPTSAIDDTDKCSRLVKAPQKALKRYLDLKRPIHAPRGSTLVLRPCNAALGLRPLAKSKGRKRDFFFLAVRCNNLDFWPRNLSKLLESWALGSYTFSRISPAVYSPRIASIVHKTIRLLELAELQSPPPLRRSCVT